VPVVVGITKSNRISGPKIPQSTPGLFFSLHTRSTSFDVFCMNLNIDPTMIRRCVATHVKNESTLLFYVRRGYYLAFHVPITLFHVNGVINLCEETFITYIISRPHHDVAVVYYGHYFIIGTICAITRNIMLIFN
jgi:hypothetical protein